MPSQPVAQEVPSSLAESGEQSAISDQRSAEEMKELAQVVAGLDYSLDWETTKINLGKGRVLTLRRPTQSEILARDAELQTEIPIGKEGGFALPDPTQNEEIDAKYFDLVKVDAAGYDGEIPEQHKATAFNGLYAREIYVDEDFDLMDATCPVLEEIGSGAEPDHTVLHNMRPPTEGELKIYRRKSANGELKPGKRGRQKFVTSSNLKTAMLFYAQWLVDITGATVEGKTWSEDERAVFIAHVDPLVQRQVVNAVVEAYTVKLSD
jgi:hypothetical protein